MKFTGITLFALLLSLSGCAQDPSPIVANTSEVGGLTGLNPAPAEKKMAVVFSGLNSNDGTQCQVKLAIEEHGGEKHFLAKVDYILHGKPLPDVEVEGYRYSLRSNTYSDVNSSNGRLALAGALLTDGSEGDVRQLRDLERTNKLEYSLRVDFFGNDYVGFSEAVEAVTANSSDLAAYRSSLEQIGKIVFKVQHAGHYDGTSCEAFEVTKVEEVEFKLGGHDDDHDDHDDDHDHDHD